MAWFLGISKLTIENNFKMDLFSSFFMLILLSILAYGGYLSYTDNKENRNDKHSNS
jgi:hypothetical protein